MATKIRDLSMREICEKYGILTSKSQIVTTLSPRKPDLAKIDEFFSKLYPLSQFNEDEVTAGKQKVADRIDFDKLVAFMDKYDDIFDKELYMLRLYKSAVRREECSTINGRLGTTRELNFGTESYVNAIVTRDGQRDYDRWIREFTRALKGVDVVDGSEDMQFDDTTSKMTIRTSQDYIGNSKNVTEKNKQADKKFAQIEKRFDLRELIYFVTPSDLVDICRYPVVGNRLKEKVFEMGYDKDKQQMVRDIVSRKETPLEEESQKEKNKKGKIFSVDNFYKVFQENREYMYPDKFLAVVLETYYQALMKTDNKFKHAEVLKLKEFSRQIIGVMDNKKISFERNLIGAEPVADVQKTIKNIDTLLGCFINAQYCSEEEVAKVRTDILSGLIPYNKIRLLDYANAMRYSTDELFKIVSNNPKALEYFITNGLITQKSLEDFLDNNESFSDNQVLAFYNQGIINNEQLLELFNSSRISLENIKFLHNSVEKPEDIEALATTDIFMELYNDPEKKETTERYGKLFKYFKLDGKTIEEKNQVGLELLDSSKKELDEASIVELYRMGVLLCDLLDLIEAPALQELYSKGELNPTDARRLFDSKIIKPQMLHAILTDSTISEEQKIVLIYSTFPKPEDSDTRETLFIVADLLEVENSIHNGQGNGTKRRKHDVIEKEHHTGKEDTTPYDPCDRWNTLAKLDDGYSEDLLRDGTIIFYLPNWGIYIIEKLFTKKHQPAYGAATYILKEDIYKKYESRIIQDGRINRSELVDLNIRKEAKKRVHTKNWAKSIYRELDKDKPTLCTPEKSQEIKKIAQEVEENKKEREL